MVLLQQVFSLLRRPPRRRQVRAKVARGTAADTARRFRSFLASIVVIVIVVCRRSRTVDEGKVVELNGEIGSVPPAAAIVRPMLMRGRIRRAVPMMLRRRMMLQMLRANFTRSVAAARIVVVVARMASTDDDGANVSLSRR